MNLLPMSILASSGGDWWWLFVILGIFAIVVIAVIIVKRKVSIFQNKDVVKSKEEIAQEELDRLLEPVETLEPKQDEDKE